MKLSWNPSLEAKTLCTAQKSMALKLRSSHQPELVQIEKYAIENYESGLVQIHKFAIENFKSGLFQIERNLIEKFESGLVQIEKIQ